MGLFRNKTEYVYYMNQEQYDEMFSFYKKLGYSENQCKKLSESCFGAKIVVSSKERYAEDWEFNRTYLRKPVEDFVQPLYSAAATFMGGRSMAKSSMPNDSARCMSARAPAPVGCPAPVEDCAVACSEPEDGAYHDVISLFNSVKAPEFNTAQTHKAPEIEESTPLDRPQMIFSANVNTASWSYIRNRVLLNRNIDGDFVRIEEIINSYPYDLKKAEDDQLFSINIEHGKCPWKDGSELMFIGLKGKKVEKHVKQNLAFLVDVSGSMEDRWVLVQMSLMAIISRLGKGDIISIIAYSDETVTVCKKLECDNLDECVKAVLSIDGIGGCTNGSEGLENSYRFLSENYDKDANNRLFIFTDGDFNFGITTEGGLTEYIKKKRETGIYLSVVGYGMSNFKDDKMEALAKNGHGNYTIVTNPEDITDNLWMKLVSNLVTVAKDVKISVELNPKYVKDYRLIGYDSRVMTQKEFHDTEKAADGIGSEHNVAAVIQLTKGEAVKTYNSRYVTTSSADFEDEFAFIEIHYKNPDGENLVLKHTVKVSDYENSSGENMPLATLLTAFGLVIKRSEYKGNADKKMLAELIDKVKHDKESENNYGHLAIIKRYIKN